MRFAPMDTDNFSETPGVIPIWRSVGGDELNVCVNLCKLGVETHWISALGDGPLGKNVLETANIGVRMKDVVVLPNERTGTFVVVPEEKKVYYDRKFSAFARHNPSSFNWEHILENASWLHMTGITPMCGDRALISWQRALDVALHRGIPCSVDLNHRKQLGSLLSLWQKVRPYVSRLFVMVLSLDQLAGLIHLEGINDDGGNSYPATLKLTPNDEVLAFTLLEKLRKRIKIKWLVICLKKRDATNLQTRWSAVSTSNGIFTTNTTPVLHRPKEDVGGGSAWFTGLCHYIMYEGEENPKLALRRADLLSALCQESLGDHSQVTLSELRDAEAEFHGRVANVAKYTESSKLSEKIADAERKLMSAKVLPIIRAKNGRVAIERGLEFGKMGCRAIEVTMDTQNIEKCLQELVAGVPENCLVGVGTVMELAQVAKVASLGARFALSPVNPPGFIKECLKYGVVPVPAASSPNEIFAYWKEGAKLIKLFPAGRWSPTLLKSLKNIGDFSKIHILPSGGISPANYKEWLNAGAVGVGMGSKLAGSDMKYADGTPEYEEARKQWVEHGRLQAKNLFKSINSTSKL